MIAGDVESDLKSRPVIPGLLFRQKLIPAFVCGILAVKWFFPSLIVFSVYLFILFIFRLEKGALPLLILLFLVGGWYADYSLPEIPGTMPDWMAAREKVLIEGRVRSVRALPGNRLKILLQDVVCNSTRSRTALAGFLNWSWDLPDRIPVSGQRVTIKARIKPASGFRNSGVWDYAFYNRTKNIFYRTYTRGPLKDGELKSYKPDFLQRLRISLRKHILQNAPPGQGGAIFPALLMGDRFHLSKDTVELIRRAGVSHVLALSGLHVGFVASLGFMLAWLTGFAVPNIYLFIPRQKLGVVLAVPPVLFYLWLGQFTPSLLRASCMFGFWGLLLLMDRGRILLDGLFMAVALILVFSPLSLFDLGFQLSVLAVAGIALFFPIFKKLLPSGRSFTTGTVRFFLSVFYLSLCANLALLPVLVWNFGVVSPDILFNLLFIPLLGFFIVPVCGIGGILLSYVNPFAAHKLFSAGGWCFDRLLSMFQWAESGGFLPEYACYRPCWEDLLIYYLLLGGLLLISCGRSGKVRLLALPLIVLLCLRIHPWSNETGVRLDLLDTGQSQCVVIRGPAGTCSVVDGGGSFGDFDMGRAVVGPWLCSGRMPVVDNIFMTHGDRDHSGGLAFLLEKFRVGRFFSNGDIPVGDIGRRMNAACAAEGSGPQILQQGDEIELEPGLIMEILHPSSGFKGSKNDRSLFLRLVWRDRPLADIAGDLDRKGVHSVLAGNMDLKADVLILPHHGSAGGYSPELYKRVDPSVALAACGLLNRYGFVAEKVRNKLESMRIPLYTTAAEGMISIEWKSSGRMTFIP